MLSYMKNLMSSLFYDEGGDDKILDGFDLPDDNFQWIKTAGRITAITPEFLMIDDNFSYTVQDRSVNFSVSIHFYLYSPTFFLLACLRVGYCLYDGQVSVYILASPIYVFGCTSFLTKLFN